MGKVRGFWLLLALGTLALPRTAYCQQTMAWESTVEAGKRAAGQSNRLVLMVFTAPWCQACRAMENDVFNRPGAAPTLQSNFVPVKINVEFFPETARQFGITSLPTTIVMAPTAKGEVLDVIRGRMDSPAYMARLNQVAADAKRRAVIVAQVPGGTAAPAAASPAMPVAPTTAAAGPANPAAAVTPPTAAGSPGMAVAATGPRPPTAGPSHPAAQPPLGLDGFCPVQLVENAKWTPGNRRWGAIHRGRTYLFVGAEEQQRFLADPDRFAPVGAGEDVVVALEQGRLLNGSREHGLSFAGKIYLFVSEETLQKFSTNPKYYAERAVQAMRAGVAVQGPVR